MMTYISIDPGIDCLGWAFWRDLPDGPPELVACATVTTPPRIRRDLGAVCRYQASVIAPHARGVRHAFVEQMRLGGERDRGSSVIAKANDLLRLQAVGAYVAGALGAEIHYAEPGTWKGSSAKTVTAARVRATLEPHERIGADHAARALGRKAHNLWDAIGIGLWGVGRYVVRGGTSPAAKIRPAASKTAGA